jgi:hypothetical protein
MIHPKCPETSSTLARGVYVSDVCKLLTYRSMLPFLILNLGYSSYSNRRRIRHLNRHLTLIDEPESLTIEAEATEAESGNNNILVEQLGNLGHTSLPAGLCFHCMLSTIVCPALLCTGWLILARGSFRTPTPLRLQICAHRRESRERN